MRCHAGLSPDGWGTWHIVPYNALLLAVTTALENDVEGTLEAKALKRTEISKLYGDTAGYIGKKLRVDGWVRTSRDMKHFGFIELNDGSCFKSLQIVLNETEVPNFSQAVALLSGSSISAEGVLAESPGGKQAFELKASFVDIICAAPPDYPLQKKRHSFEFLRGISHLRPRTNAFRAVFKVRSVAAHGIHGFFQENGFVHVHTPIITSSDSEGAGEMFRVTVLDPAKIPFDKEGNVDFTKDFFGIEANLTVSGQLEAEAFAHAFDKVYTFGPTFRAENSNTPRHAAEFWMIEPEMAFTDLSGNMDIAEDMIKYLIGYLFENAGDELDFLNSFVDKGLLSRLENVRKATFERMTYTEAVSVLEKNNKDFEFQVTWGCDLQTEHERFLSEKVAGAPVFVTDYPKGIKAFYMRMNDDGNTVAAMDLLVPGVGELIGGSQREERHGYLERRLREMQIDVEEYRWYLDLRRFGGVKHAGFGLGFERALMYFTGMSNIRDVLPFPRTTGSAG